MKTLWKAMLVLFGLCGMLVIITVANQVMDESFVPTRDIMMILLSYSFAGTCWAFVSVLVSMGPKK